MHRVKHGPMDPCFFLPFFWAGRGGKSALGTRLPCVPLCPLCLLCPLCSLCPLCPLSRVSRVPCIPCVPCVPCVPLCSVCALSCVSRFRVCPVSLLPFQKNEMFGGVALVSCGMWRENFDGFLCFHMTTCRFFFRTLRRSKDVIFHENRK